MTDINNDDAPNTLEKHRLNLYIEMLKDSLKEKINFENSTPADKIVIRHIEEELLKLIRSLNV